MSYPTTRRHARSLAEAFPDERAQWLEGPQRVGHKAVPYFLALAVIAIVLSICFGVKP